MPEILDHVAYLSQEIGPRPAGTEEEQQAALYITDQMQQEAGLSAVMEDFKGSPDLNLANLICCLCAIVITIAALIVPAVGVAAIVVTAIAAVLYVLEALDKPILSNLLSRGISQNVVAKYDPGFSSQTGSSRRLKVILVARYDSGKVRPETSPVLLKILPIMQWVIVGALVLLPIVLAINTVAFANAEGMGNTVMRVITIVLLVIAAIPPILSIVHKASPYNEGANCNAAGTAVLLEVARRVGKGCVSEAELARRDNAVVHGYDAALASGEVSPDTELTYMTHPTTSASAAEDEDFYGDEELRLASAKAAMAAFLGKPVEGAPTPDELERMRNRAARAQRSQQEEALAAAQAFEQQTMSSLFGAEDGEYEQSAGFDAVVFADEQQADEALEQQVLATPDAHADEAPMVLQAEPVHEPEEDDSVPAWFKAAQAKAKKSDEPEKPAQRSRYASALDAAVVESAAHFAQANNIVEHELEESLAAGRDEIREVKAPQWATAQSAGQTSSQPAVQAEQVTSVSEVETTDVVAEGAPAAGAAQGGVVEFVPTVESAVNPHSPRIMVPAIETESAQPARPPIQLPDIDANTANLTPVAELTKQRAPLADAQTSSQSAAKSLLTLLPAISLDDPHATGSTGKIPSITGSLDPIGSGSHPVMGVPEVTAQDADSVDPMQTQAVPVTSVNAAGAFVPAGATGSFAPIGDELIENVAPEDIYIDDVDDSAYQESMTETGAFAGPGYVEMPKSRMQRLFGKFRHKDKDVEPTPQEWLDVDEDFDARSVGAKRGGWESFRSADYDSYDEQFSATSGSFEDDSWNGGAFSVRRMESADLDSKEIVEEAASAAAGQIEIEDELQQIYQFRNPDINTEVWFVALGSELEHNGGMRAFLDEHQQDMRGSIIIDLDALGAGDLCVIGKEGRLRTVKTSSRIKRYIRKASQATQFSVGEGEITWKDSAASYAAKRGYQTMHLCGMKDGKPAYFAQADDVLENTNEETLRKNADFVMELLKII